MTLGKNFLNGISERIGCENLIGILASGSGSNFKTLHSLLKNRCSFRLLHNETQTELVNYCDSFQIPHVRVSQGSYPNRQSHEEAMLEVLQGWHRETPFDLVVLAGFMRILTPYFIQHFHQSITRSKASDDPQVKAVPLLNLHPADPGLYKGARALEYAYRKKFPRWSGCLHEVEAELDSGKIVAMQSFGMPAQGTLTQWENQFKRQENDFFAKEIIKIWEEMKN